MSHNSNLPTPSSSRRAQSGGIKPEVMSDHESRCSDSDDEGPGWAPQEGASPKENMPPSSALAACKNNKSTAAGNRGSTENVVVPMQKRRRITRACDECRRKKIKCDGKQPCTHCEVYSYECTYDKPSNRRRNPAPQYVEALEDRLIRAENLLRQFMPNVDLADPNLDPAVQQEFRNRERARALAAGVPKENLKALAGTDAQILSMIESLGQLDIDDKGAYFLGMSSGTVFLKKIQEHFPPGMLQSPAPTPFKAESQASILNIEPSGSSANSPWSRGESPARILPQRETVDRLCYLSLNCATCLIRIVHIPSFTQMIERLYEIPTETYEIRETRFLGLLYAVMALGCLYDLSQDSKAVNTTQYEAAVGQGFVSRALLWLIADVNRCKYYNTSRLILRDITDCQDLTTLQALLFMILFQQGTSHLTGCYAFVGIAFRSAIAMGLHRKLPHPKMSKIEDQVRRRVFYIIRQMDTYVSAVLGFPVMNMDDAVDQPYPAEVDDDYITDDEILTPVPGTPSVMQAFNAHTKLMEILAKIIKYVYPLRGTEHGGVKGGNVHTRYPISYRRILEVETELQQWLEKLPDAWKPSNEGSSEVVRVRHLLRFAYAHVQMLLYRPFIHYSSPRLTQSKSIDQRAFHCAASAVNISRNIVHIGTEMRKQGVLIGPYWFILYTELFAILSLVFYVLENPDKAGSDEILADAVAGRDMIARIEKRTALAEKTLFEKLPETLGKSKGSLMHSKKRCASNSRQLAKPCQVAPLLGQPGRSSDMADPTSDSLEECESAAVISHGASADSVPSGSESIPAHLMKPDLQGMMFDGTVGATLTCSSVNPTGSHYDAQHQHEAFRAGQAGQQPHQHHNQPSGSAKPLYNDMFPSSDPFAYPPSQPLLELRHRSVNSVGAQGQDSVCFGLRGTFDSLEGQLVQIPAYLMETQSVQPEVDLSPHVYDTPGMMNLGHSGHSQQQQNSSSQNHDQYHQGQAHQQQPQGYHHNENSMQELYANCGNLASGWNPSFFQNTDYRS